MNNLFVSYPKSGRTWIRVMLTELDVLVQYTHFDTGFDKASWGKPQSSMQKSADLPEKCVFLYRDPRDAVISLYHHMTKRLVYKPAKRLRLSLLGKMPPQDLHSFVTSERFGIEKVVLFNLHWAEYLDALTFSYEDMRADPVDHMVALLSFLGHNVPREKIKQVVKQNTFEKMQQKEASGGFDDGPLALHITKSDSDDENSFKVRRGKVGGWQDEMLAETAEFCDAIFKKHDYFARMKKLTDTEKLVTESA